MEISIFTNQTQQCIERLHTLWTSVMYFSHTLEVSIHKSMKSISLQQAVRENANDYMNWFIKFNSSNDIQHPLLIETVDNVIIGGKWFNIGKTIWENL